jgi:uncharacterized protein YukE
VKGPVQAMSDSLSGDQKQEGNQPVMTTTHLCIDPRPEQVFSDIAEACDNKKQEGNQSTSPTVSSQLDPGSMSVIGDGLLEGKGEGNQCSSQEVATVSQLNPGDIAHRLSEKSENQIKQGSSNAVMSRPMSDKADSLLEAFDNQKQDGNESSSWKSYAVTTHSCVAQRPYQTMSDIADGLSEVSKNQKQDGNLFTESNAVTIKQVQLQVDTCVCVFVRIHLVHSRSTHKGKEASGSFCPNLSSSVGASPIKSTDYRCTSRYFTVLQSDWRCRF